MRYENPNTGLIKESNNAWLWVLLFGAFYFAYKGVWLHTFVMFLVYAASVLLSPTWQFHYGVMAIMYLVYMVKVNDILHHHYYTRGWFRVS